MKKIILLPAMLGIIIGCSSGKDLFTEKIIDRDGPQDIWMKTTGDLNGDGKTDMLAGGWKKGGIVAYMAPGWEKRIICDTLKISTDAETCDIDQDNKLDIVAIAREALVWISGSDNALHCIDSVELHDIEIGDLDNDGLIDVIGRNQAEWGRGDTVYIFRQMPSGKWSKIALAIANGEGLKSADVNGDRRQDIIVNGYWLENTGNIGEWPEHRFTGTWDWRNTYIDVADMNGDSYPDIVLSPSELAGGHYRVSWFEGSQSPDSVWKEHVVVDSIESVIHFIGAADFNLDGRMDFMLAHMQQGKDPDEVSVFIQQDDLRWEKQVISTGGCHSIRLFDCDGDGDTDAFGGNWEENVVKMWVNNTRESKP